MGSASLPELGFIPKTPLPGQCRRSVSEAVLAASLTECFFTTYSPCRQSCREHRIAPSILLWQQDCSTQSCCGNRIAIVNPGLGAGLLHQLQTSPLVYPENSGSAVLYSTTPPDSPPGLCGKHRQCVGTQRCTPGLAARLPGVEFWDSRRSVTRRARARTSAPPRRAARCSPRPGRRRERGG